MSTSRFVELVRGTRGAASVETLVGFPIVYLFFTIIIQLGYLEVASLLTQHAAVVAARAAVVVAADDPAYYGSGPGTLDGRRRAEVDEAVRLVLARSGPPPRFVTTFEGGFVEGQIVTAKVELDYPCTVPFGGRFVCGIDGKRHLVREAKMPYQGAAYEYP